MSAIAAAADVRRSRVRFFVVTMLFLVTTVNYADRATLSIAGSALSKELSLDPVAMGYVFSAFGWSYVIAQVPGGWLLVGGWSPSKRYISLSRETRLNASDPE